MQQNKLKKDFEAALTSFKEIENVKMQKEKAFVRKARASISAKSNPYAGHDGPSDATALLAAQAQSQEQLRLNSLENEIDFNDEIIAERESEIREIEETIGEVNEIFRDLAEIVNEQGEMLGEIDNNIESTVSHTDGAATQLRIANDYHKSARNKQFCCYGIIALICIAVVVALSVGLKK